MSASKSAVDAVPPSARSSLAMLLPTAGFVGMACHVTVAEWIFASKVDGGFGLVEHAHGAAIATAARTGFAWVFAAAAAVAAAASLLARVLSGIETRAAQASQAA